MNMDQLRPITETDVPMILEWRNHPDVRRMMYTQHVITAEEHLAWWRSQHGRDDRRHFIFEADDVALGVVSFSAINFVDRMADWAFYARLPAPKGTGRRMESAALDFAFQEIGLTKLCCEVLSFNTRVIDLHKSFGFRIAQILQDHVKIADKYETVVRLALTYASWHQSNSKKQGE